MNTSWRRSLLMLQVSDLKHHHRIRKKHKVIKDVLDLHAMCCPNREAICPILACCSTSWALSSKFIWEELSIRLNEHKNRTTSHILFQMNKNKKNTYVWVRTILRMFSVFVCLSLRSIVFSCGLLASASKYLSSITTFCGINTLSTHPGDNTHITLTAVDR